jgi:hypothetical protein
MSALPVENWLSRGTSEEISATYTKQAAKISAEIGIYIAEYAILVSAVRKGPPKAGLLSCDIQSITSGKERRNATHYSLCSKSHSRKNGLQTPQMKRDVRFLFFAIQCEPDHEKGL